MTTPMHTHASVRVISVGEQSFASLVVRAVFALGPSGLCEPLDARDGLAGPLGALSDDASAKPHADVVLVGHVAAHTRPYAVVGLAVARGPDVLLRRRLVAFGPRLGRSGERSPIPRFPIGPAAHDDAPRGEEPAGPWLLDPDAPRGPDGWGPLPPSARRGEPSIAPTAQRMGPLRGGEQVLLVGLGGAAEPWSMRLPASTPYATVEGPGLAPTSVPLVGDTLAIDVDARCVLLTFRGSVPLLGAARALSSSDLHVVSGLAPVRAIEELRGSPRDWPRGAPSAPPRPPPRSVDRLQLHDDSGFVSRCFVSPTGPAQGERVLVVRGRFDVVRGASARLAEEQGKLAGDVFVADDPRGALLRAGDLAPHKREVDVLVRGAAHGAAGQTSALVTLRLGALEARLVALGPRRWRSDGTPSAPGPLEPVPLTWESAYGGPGFADNPVGTGHAPGTAPPRLEDPSRLLRVQGERVRPVAFAPVAPSWPGRATHLGTFDAAWQKSRWPAFPADFDEAFFSAAPPALRTRLVSPSEAFRLTSVCPGGGPFEGQLAGLFPRAFATTERGLVAELPLVLDTVLLCPDEARVELTWRGRFAPARGDDPLLRVTVLRDDERSPASALTCVARVLALAEPHLAPLGDPPPALAEPPADVFRERRRAARERPPAPPPPLDRARVLALLAANKSLAGRDLSDARLEGLDLSGKDLRRTIFARAELGGARFDGARLAGASFAGAHAENSTWDGADLSRADLAGATLDGASFVEARLDDASFAGARLVGAHLERARGERTRLAGAELERASLDGAVLPKAVLSRARLTGATLRAVTLDDAKLDDADARRACFEGASLENARFAGAALEGAVFAGVRARGASWEQASAHHADLRGALLEGGVLTDAELDEADLRGVAASRARFRGASLRKTRFDGAQLSEASFEEAELDGTSFRGACLFQAEVGGADARRAVLANAQLDGTKWSPKG